MYEAFVGLAGKLFLVYFCLVIEEVPQKISQDQIHSKEGVLRIL